MRTGRKRKRFSATTFRANADAAKKVEGCTARIVPLRQQSSRARRWQISAAPLTTTRLCAASRRRNAWHVRVNRPVKLRIDPGGIARGSIVPAIFCATGLVPFQRFFFPSSHARDVNRFGWFAHTFTPADIVSGLTMDSGHSPNFGTNPTGTDARSIAPSTSSALTSGAAA